MIFTQRLPLHVHYGCKRCNDGFSDYMTGNAPATDYKCNDYHQNDGAKGATITNATSTVAGYLPAARKVCPTTLADAETKRCVVSSADAENNRVVSSADAEQQGQNDKPADPDERMAESRALGLLPAPSAGSFARACTPTNLFFSYPISTFFLPQVHSSWLMPTEGV